MTLYPCSVCGLTHSTDGPACAQPAGEFSTTLRVLAPADLAVLEAAEELERIDNEADAAATFAIATALHQTQERAVERVIRAVRARREGKP